MHPRPVTDHRKVVCWDRCEGLCMWWPTGLSHEDTRQQQREGDGTPHGCHKEGGKAGKSPTVPRSMAARGCAQQRHGRNSTRSKPSDNRRQQPPRIPGTGDSRVCGRASRAGGQHAGRFCHEHGPQPQSEHPGDTGRDGKCRRARRVQCIHPAHSEECAVWPRRQPGLLEGSRAARRCAPGVGVGDRRCGGDRVWSGKGLSLRRPGSGMHGGQGRGEGGTAGTRGGRCGELLTGPAFYSETEAADVICAKERDVKFLKTVWLLYVECHHVRCGQQADGSHGR